MYAEEAFRHPSGKESHIHSDVLRCPHVLELSWGLNYRRTFPGCNVWGSTGSCLGSSFL